MFYLYLISVNGQRGFCEIINEKDKYKWDAECQKPIFEGSYEECEAEAKKLQLVVKDFSDIKQDESHIWRFQ